MIHGLAGLAAFTLLPAACFVMAWHFASESGSRPWAAYSVAVGVLLLVMFVASTTVSTLDAAGAWPNAPTGFLQRIAIIAGWTWIALVALHLVRKDEIKDRSRARRRSGPRNP